MPSVLPALALNTWTKSFLLEPLRETVYSVHTRSPYLEQVNTKFFAFNKGCVQFDGLQAAKPLSSVILPGGCYYSH